MRGFCATVTLILSMAIVVGWPAPRAAAQGPQVVISQVKSGNVLSPRLVELYNNSSLDVDITDWCIYYATSTSRHKVVCFDYGSPLMHTFLPAGQYMVLTSPQLDIVANEFFEQSLGNGINGALLLVDAKDEIIDAVGWGDSIHAEGQPVIMGETKTIERVVGEDGLLVDTNNNTADFFISDLRDEYYPAEYYISQDLCTNIEGFQVAILDGYELNDVGECVQSQEPLLPLVITELLPNAKGSDVGTEYIEIHNPNDVDVQLDDYYLRVGLELDKKHLFPSGLIILAGAHVAFYNTEIKFSLNNTTGRMALFNAHDQLVAETLVYDKPGEDLAWALIQDEWQYTNQPTPGLSNLPSIETPASTVQEKASPLPCPAGKYRHPETNRCRNIEVTVSPSLQPCGPDQERNPDTNRCRKIASKATQPTPCKEGQERNPDTNRCRNIPAMPVEIDYGVMGDIEEVKQEAWPWWLALGIVGSAAGGYAVWEWRQELRKASQWLLGRLRFGHRK